MRSNTKTQWTVQHKVDTQALQKNYSWAGKDRIAYYDEGPKKAPALLFIHGIPTSAYLWRKIIGPLSHRWRCLAPDLLGLGDSSGSDEAPLTLSAQADRIVRFLDILDVGPIVIIGHDIGGIVAQIIALRHMNRTVGLILVDSACYDNWPVGILRYLRTLSSSPLVYTALCKTGMLARLAHSQHGYRLGVKHPGSLSKTQIDEYIRPLVLSESAQKLFRRFLLSLSPMESREIAHKFHGLTTPTLIVWALDDAFLPLKWGERLATDIPSSTLKTISDCGHFVPEERPQRFLATIDDFLESLNEPSVE